MARSSMIIVMSMWTPAITISSEISSPELAIFFPRGIVFASGLCVSTLRTMITKMKKRNLPIFFGGHHCWNVMLSPRVGRSKS